MKYEFIENNRSDFSVMKMCKALNVSRSGYFKWRNREPSQQELLRKKIKDRIVFHYYDSENVYGSPKITKQLQKEGYTITERTVSKYMQELGLRSCVSKKFKVITTNSNHDYPVAPNKLNQNFTTSAPNKVWVADITYIPCGEGRLYLASILDLFTREIVGWRLYGHMETQLVLDALNDAYQAKKPDEGLLHHSDRGTQYASKDYREKLQEYGMEASMSRTGNCYDNACAESFFSLLKKELIQGRRFQTKKQAYTEIFRYIEFFYNRKRIHGSIGYLSPVEYAQKYYERISA
ncbi:IS3 family transposase [Bacillus sp. DTU_2020_1000418_1_SI_GHA_SEK_038]|uniref:IS3 family transposase n=1 Tax=Bacillus sp. DTU_2020_1000418_1_SI_GHA_SEK_038 TaxID=3077585 RepID=UPI0028EADF41|nr:IS3 family transposase [Bacillus sp. DTU_2020_1000418_1_SI_GHA_SEK_038]WNS76341.1 IS3 family transposase [Bacillus sp. DTU_2020_1000418_1_SI_GHA_SEK_038]